MYWLKLLSSCNVILTTSFILDSIASVSTYLRLDSIVVFMLLKNLPFRDSVFWISKKDRSWVILLESISESSILNADFKFNWYQLQLFWKLSSPLIFLSLNFDSGAAITFFDELVHTMAIDVAIPRDLSII